ncbi:MAG: hypothetical protein ACRDZM_05525 [Acidimicrobiia bacterium]
MTSSGPAPPTRSLATGRLPAGLTRRMIRIPPGSCRPYRPLEWAGKIVLVYQGDIELEGLSGRRYVFRSGSLVHLDRLPLGCIHNEGPQLAVMIAVGRLAGPES